MLDDRAEREGGQEVERADEQDRAEQQDDEVPPETGNVPALAGAISFARAIRPAP